MKFFLLFLAFASTLCAESIEKKVSAHLAIHDTTQALSEVQAALKVDPDNWSLMRLEILCLAKKKDIPALLASYRRYTTHSSTPLDPQLLEEISWAIIKQASLSNSSVIRQEALISAVLANSSESIPLFLQALVDPSNDVRMLALKLAQRTRDDPIQKQLFEHFVHTSSPHERILSMLSLAAASNSEIQEKLSQVLFEETTSANEKMAAIHAMAYCLPNRLPEEITPLLSSNRALLRAAACQIALHIDCPDSLLKQIQPLVYDSCPQVRYSALTTLGLLSKNSDFITDSFLALCQHSDAKTSLLASWALLIHNHPELAENAIKKHLKSQDLDVACFAASVVAQSGSAGTSLSIWGIHTIDNPFVAVNLAMGLIWQRKELQLAKEAILEMLNRKAERISWHQEGIFSYISKSHVTHVAYIPYLPETEDLMTRLDLIKRLAVCDMRKLDTILKPLLQERAWGITGQAASIMIQEGLDGFECLESLLNDKNAEVALQAAFILASQTQSEKALDIFEKQYWQASRHIKEQILVGIGQIGHKRSLNFLVKVLDEPFESLRISAARSILLCLEH